VRTRNRAELAERLRQLADDVERGRYPVPRLGIGPARHGAEGITVPAVVHDLLCGWRVRVRLDTQPPVSACIGCGLTVPDTTTDTAAGQEADR
jgi:hypothetical protein